MDIFKKMANSIHSLWVDGPKHSDYSQKTLDEIEYEWHPYGITPKIFFEKWGEKLFKALSDTVDTSYWGMFNREGSEQEANLIQEKMVEDVIAIGLKRYGYRSTGELVGDKKYGNTLLRWAKQSVGIYEPRLDAKEEIIRNSICEFWDGFQRRYYDAYHDRENYVRPFSPEYVGKLFKYELAYHGKLSTWRSN